jgi:hypothetical protein
MLPHRNELFGTIALVILLAGCGTAKRKEGIAELQRIHTAANEIKIVVTAGVNQQEFSRRLTDTLLKIGDLQQIQSQMLTKFPENDRERVSEAFRHLDQALQAYKRAKEFFGDDHEDGPDRYAEHNTFGQREYDSLKQQFPNLAMPKPAITYTHEERPRSDYWRGDMLQALWKAAADESESAKRLIDRLEKD